MQVSFDTTEYKIFKVTTSLVDVKKLRYFAQLTKPSMPYLVLSEYKKQVVFYHKKRVFYYKKKIRFFTTLAWPLTLFQVSSCLGVYSLSERDCGPLSSSTTGSTLYNAPKMVEDVVVTCSRNDFRGWSVEVTWKPSSGAKETGTYHLTPLKSPTCYALHNSS